MGSGNVCKCRLKLSEAARCEHDPETPLFLWGKARFKFISDLDLGPGAELA